MKHLQNILDGMAGVLGSLTTYRDYQRETGGFARDHAALASDARKVAGDIRINTNKAYGKQRTSNIR